MAVSMSKTREQFPLSRKKILKKTLAGAFIWITFIFSIYMVFAAVLFTIPESRGMLGIGAVILLMFMALIVLLLYLYQQWYYDIYFYDLTPEYVIIKKGPITPHEITIPYERIQDVYVDQDILDRIFGIYDVHLSSATISSGMVAHIDGVEKTAAEGLRAKLLEAVSAKIGRPKPQQIASEPPKEASTK